MTTPPDAPGSWSAPSPSSAPPPPWGQQSWGGQNPSDAQPWARAPGGGGVPAWGPDPYAPGPGGPPGHIGPPVPPRPTNAWAVTALVTGILAIVPVAIVAGVVALNQTARTGEQGRGMAIAGLVLSGLWTVVSLVAAALLAWAFLALGEGWGWDDDLTLEPPMATTEMIAGLDVGACLQMGRVSTSVSCEVAHDAEVYLRSQLPDAETYPGEEELTWQADEICFQAFEGYVGRGYYASELEYGFYVPDATTWSEGDRDVACVVVPFAGDELVGPARDSRR